MSGFVIRHQLRRLSVVVLCLLLLMSALLPVAQGAPLSQGVLFSDNFEDGNANGWNTSGGSWSVIADGSQVYNQNSTSSDAKSSAGSLSWTNQTMEARVKPMSFNGADRFAAILARFTNNTNYYYLALRSSNRLEIGKRVAGGYTALASVNFTVSTGTWYTLRLQVNGTSLSGSVNGAALVSASDSTFASGKVGLASLNASARFDDVVVTTPGGVVPSNTPTRTNTPPGPTNTPTRTPTNTPPGPTNTPTRTSTPTRTPTPGGVNFALIGYATVNGTTTGGAGGPTVTVSNLSALRTAAAAAGSMIIQINTTITGGGSDEVDVNSNKTIIGVGTSGRLVGIFLNIDDGVSNIIVRNLSIEKVLAPGDNIHIQGPGVHHIWIDHNDLSSDTTHDQDFYDGALDITHDVEFVTVSWNVFHDHWKTSLIGHSDNNAAEDTGSFHVTYHHNYFRNVASRGPSIRFGTLHSFNNFFENFFDAETGISSRMGACARIENNVFTGVANPVLTTQSGTGSEAGGVQLIGNAFGGGVIETTPTCTLNPPYSFTAEGIGSVPSTVQNNAGVGKIGN